MKAQAASLGKPTQPDKLMESVLLMHEQPSSKKQQSVSDTPRIALIPNLMGPNIVAPEPVVQPAEAVQQAALASETIGAPSGKSHQTFQTELLLMSTLEEEDGGNREGAEEGEEVGLTLVVGAMMDRVEGTVNTTRSVNQFHFRNNACPGN